MSLIDFIVKRSFKGRKLLTLFVPVDGFINDILVLEQTMLEAKLRELRD